MIYRGPGFLAFLRFGSSPSPVIKLFLFLCLPVYRRSSLLTERGWGMEPNHTLLKNPPCSWRRTKHQGWRRKVNFPSDLIGAFRSGWWKALVFFTVYDGGKSWSSVNHSIISASICPGTECRAVGPLLSLSFFSLVFTNKSFFCILGASCLRDLK